MSLEHSRGLRLGAGATGVGESDLERRLAGSEVTVSADLDEPGVPLATETLLGTLRRGLGHVYWLGGRAHDNDRLLAGPRAIDPSRPIELVDDSRGLEIHVGSSRAPTIQVVPDRYGCRIGGDRYRQGPAEEANAMGSVFAAALGAAEVFKHQVQPLASRRRWLSEVSYCPVGLTSDLCLAPRLDSKCDLNLMMVGLGAVGSASALILGGLHLGGRVTVVDPERYEAPNRGSYSLGNQADVNKRVWKTELAAAALPNFEVTEVRARIEALPPTIDAGELAWPGTLLLGLDSKEARHAAQRLWPDHLVDAATGDTAAGMQEVFAGGQPCLMCLLPPEERRQSALIDLNTVTGLPLAVLRQGDKILNAVDLKDSSAAQRRRLEPLIGTEVCGLAQALGLTGIADDTYQASVPFVSQLAACLGIGRILARCLRLEPFGNLVQMDALVGPQAVEPLIIGQRSGCYCQERQQTIKTIRARRREAVTQDRDGREGPRASLDGRG